MYILCGWVRKEMMGITEWKAKNKMVPIYFLKNNYCVAVMYSVLSRCIDAVVNK